MKPKCVKLAAILLTSVATLLPRPALAQLTVGANTNVINLGIIFIGNDIAYDPDHDLYLSVAAYGPVYGVFVSPSGAAAGAPFRIGSAGAASYGHYPRTIYSRDLNGGSGGFLVTWHQGDGYLHSVVIASPSGAMSEERLISDGGQGGTRAGGNTGLAYSKTSHRFLVSWTTNVFGVQGRFLDSAGVPSGPVTQYVDAGGAQEPQLAWHSVTDEFGMIYGGFNSVASWVGFKRVPASGASPSAPTTFGFAGGVFSPSVSVNTSTNHYVVGWSLGGGAKGAEFDQSGNKIGDDRFLASRLGTPTSFELAYNPVSNTFLAVSEDPKSIEVAGIELNPDGSPISVGVGLSSGATSGSFVPRLTARTSTKEWSISYSRNMNALANQLISTATAGTGGGGGGGGSPPPTSPLTVTGLALSPGSPVSAGTQVTLSASSTGGAAPVQYQFWRYNYSLGTWTLAQSWSTSNQITWTPSAFDGGWQKVQVWARSAGGAALESWMDKEFLVQTPAPKILSLKTSASSSGPFGFTPGIPVTISSQAVGGQTGVIEYQFWRYNTSTSRWSLDRPWSTTKSYTWTPAGSDEGLQYIQVWVRDSGQTDWQDWVSTELVVSSVSGTLITPMTATVADGDTLPFSVLATGTAGSYEFKFWRYSVSTGSWRVIREYSPTSTFAWVPTSLDQGQNRIQVWIRPAGSATPFSAWVTTDVVTVLPPR